eukprot:355723-Rhodomonas_salina.1
MHDCEIKAENPQAPYNWYQACGVLYLTWPWWSSGWARSWRGKAEARPLAILPTWYADPTRRHAMRFDQT